MKHSILFIFFFYQISCIGQTIQKILVNDYKLNDNTVSEINETKTYFEKSGTSIYNRTYYYNPKGFVTKMIGLDTEGELSVRMSYEYDNLDNLIQIKDEKWNNSLGYSLTTTNFRFELLNLVGIELIGNGGKIEDRFIVQTENGYPVKITSYNRDNILVGYEIAEYNYNKNEVLIKVFNSREIQFGKTIVLKLNLNNDVNFKVDGVVKNEFGDITQELKPTCLSCDELATFKYVYKYDNNKNWISKVTYEQKGIIAEKILKEKRNLKYRITKPEKH
ncbi:hypothetical protein [Flavobacterium sp. YJ01]|uniref:hypothetical protein n=1 Tax=unclassified Flavobacterium TaxID=196869 RepID=UPI0023E35457|nr:hypothetical protein [Flavobacterium sp. YJ01]WET04349.1 hypothetical protein P0R33_08425 [Flavobacterium sp. YJ01]